METNQVNHYIVARMGNLVGHIKKFRKKNQASSLTNDSIGVTSQSEKVPCAPGLKGPWD